MGRITLTWVDLSGLKRVLRQLTEIFNWKIEGFGSDAPKPRETRNLTIKYYSEVPDCFVQKGETHFEYYRNQTLDTSGQIIPFLGAPTLLMQRVKITVYKYGPPDSGGCCKGSALPAGIEEILHKSEGNEAVWKSIYHFIESIGRTE